MLKAEKVFPVHFVFNECAVSARLQRRERTANQFIAHSDWRSFGLRRWVGQSTQRGPDLFNKRGRTLTGAVRRQAAQTF